MARAEVVIRGGRDPLGDPGGVLHPSRGQDIAVMARIDGVTHVLPCTAFVIRCDGRRTVVTCNLYVDEMVITGIDDVDTTQLVKAKHGG